MSFSLVGEDPEARAITSAIVALAHELGLRVVAEGVETEEQECFLATLHCDELQGFRFCEPLDAEAIARFLAERVVASV